MRIIDYNYPSDYITIERDGKVETVTMESIRHEFLQMIRDRRKAREDNVKLSDYIATHTINGTTWSVKMEDTVLPPGYYVRDQKGFRHVPFADPTPTREEIISTLDKREGALTQLNKENTRLRKKVKEIDETSQRHGTCPKGHPLWRSQTNHQLICTECKRADPEWTLEKVQKREKRIEMIASLARGALIFMCGWVAHYAGSLVQIVGL